MNSNISKLNSHKLIDAEEKLAENAKKFAYRFDRLAIITYRLGYSEKRVRKMYQLSVAIAKIMLTRAKVEREIISAHTMTEEEYELLAAG